jgi:hypothetical protein
MLPQAISAKPIVTRVTRPKGDLMKSITIM